MGTRWLALGGFLLAAAALPASAEVVALTATLSAASEVPPVQSSGSGSAAITFNTETRSLTWEVQVRGLTAPVTASHFHGPSTTAANAGVMVPIAKAGDQSPFKGSATLNPEQAADLMAGRWYVNVHTSTYPPGEIRGQVMKK